MNNELRSSSSNSIRDAVMNNLTPSEFYLSKNYPNPFKEKTTIKYCVAYKTKVRLEVFDPEGKMVKILIDEEKEAGTYEVEFSAFVCHPGENRNLSEGIYIYKLQTDLFIDTKKMLFIK